MTTPYNYPTEYFHCLLDEQPYYLVPSRLYRPVPEGPLMINPQSWFAWHGPMPPDKAARLVAHEYLLPSEAMIWVDDPGTHALWPYWLGPEYVDYLVNELPGHLLSRELPAHAVWVLVQAQILVGLNFPEQRHRQWQDVVWSAAQSFERGYASLEGLIPPLHLGALRRYYRFHTRTGSFQMGDGQVARRHVAHNEGVARFVHCQLNQAISDVARAVLRPSYSYLAAYESGSVLDRHTDREQCEYTLTLSIDASPEPEAQVLWPIQLDIPEGTLRIWQHVGDGLLFRGRSLPHYRDALAPGYTSTSLLLHYVDHNFDGALR